LIYIDIIALSKNRAGRFFVQEQRSVATGAIFNAPPLLWGSREFCTNSVDKIVRNALLPPLSH
jgi:hypothetical protein